MNQTPYISELLLKNGENDPRRDDWIKHTFWFTQYLISMVPKKNADILQSNSMNISDIPCHHK